MPSPLSVDQPKSFQAAPDYLNYYGIKVNPFAASFIFITPQFEKLLRLASHLVSYSQKLIVLTGEKGVGKTALIDELVRRQNPEQRLCRMNALKLDTPSQVLREISSAFELRVGEVSEKTQILKTLNGFFAEVAADGERCLVVLDDAHLLKNRVFEVLIELSLKHPDGIRLILSGEPSLYDSLLALPLIQENPQLVYHHPLAAFTLKDCKQYLQALFSEADQQLTAPFSAADYLKIYQQSLGLPGEIRQCAQNLLQQGVQRLLVSSTNPVWKRASALVLGLSVLVVASALFWPDNSPTIESHALRLDKPKSLTVKRVERQVASKASVGGADSGLTGLAGSTASVVASGSRLEFEPATELIDTQSAFSLTQRQTTIDKEALIHQAKELQSPQLADEKSQIDVALLEQKAIVDTAAHSETAQQDIEKSTETASYTADEQAIIGADPQGFTLQLLGLRDEHSIRALLEGLPVDGQYKYFKSEHNGGPWYVLIYGNFADRQQALEAAAALPKKLRPQSAWIRRYSGIQKILVARNRN